MLLALMPAKGRVAHLLAARRALNPFPFPGVDLITILRPVLLGFLVYGIAMFGPVLYTSPPWNVLVDAVQALDPVTLPSLQLIKGPRRKQLYQRDLNLPLLEELEAGHKVVFPCLPELEVGLMSPQPRGEVLRAC